jgi:hypothetical protein
MAGTTIRRKNDWSSGSSENIFNAVRRYVFGNFVMISVTLPGLLCLLLVVVVLSFYLVKLWLVNSKS